jgi:MFS family permease
VIHELALASTRPEASGFIVSGIKGIFALIGAILGAIICGFLAAYKRRSVLLWAILGLIFSLLSIIVLLILPKKSD